MKTINDWYKEKRDVYYQAKQLRELVESEERTLTQEEHDLWDKYKERMEDIQRNIDALEQMREMSKTINEPIIDGTGKKVGSVDEKYVDYTKALDKWMRKGAKGVTPEERKILNIQNIDLGPAVELRAPGGLTNPTYVQTTDVMGAIEAAKKYYGGWLSAVDEIRTGKGNLMNWPTVDDTSYTGALEAAGTDGFNSSDGITLGYKQLSAYIYSSQGVAIANDSLEDADFDLAKVLGDILGERLWRAISTAATTGTGSSQPQGIARAAATGVLSGAVTRARLLQLIKTVDYAYHLSPGAGFMLHSQTMYDIAALSVGSSDDRPLWQPSMVAGVPNKIEGFPYWVNNDLSPQTTVAALSRHILFGDFKKFKVRYAGPTMLVRLTERYAELFQTGFIAVQRMDSELIAANATTYNPVKYLRVMAT